MLGYFREQSTGLRGPARLADSLFVPFEGATVAASLGVAPDAVRTARNPAPDPWRIKSRRSQDSL